MNCKGLKEAILIIHITVCRSGNTEYCFLHIMTDIVECLLVLSLAMGTLGSENN